MQLGLNITPDYKFYILFCGVFAPPRNAVKNWQKYEDMFLELVKKDGINGGVHLFQAIILYFVRKFPDQQKYLGSFCKLLYD